MVRLETDETIQNEVRRHWFVMAFPVVLSVVTGLLPLVALVLLYFLPFTLDDIALFEGPITALMVAVYTLWLLALVVFLTVQWTEYYLDVWYVTNKRIIDVEQVSLFSRRTKSLRFERIQDITVDVRGFIATALNFGDVHVQTAGVAREIIIRQARRPYDLRRMILRASDRSTERFYAQHADHLKRHFRTATDGDTLSEPPEDDGLR